MKKLLIAGLCSLVLTVIAGKLIIPLLRKIKAGQTVLEYVETHKDKNGTPTMGGLFFISVAVVTFFVFGGIKYRFATVSVTIGLAFMIVGFLDDFIKIKFKHNQGLKAYQKIIFQTSIAIVSGVFSYINGITYFKLPFTSVGVNIGVWTIPVVALIFIAITNSVNLTDGLDGLAGNTSFVYLIFIALLISLQSKAFASGNVLLDEFYGLELISVTLACSILGFLVFNTNKAKVFMGDTGSLSLGGFVGAISIFSFNSFFIPVIGIMFVVSSISVIVQVLYFKKTKKRVFLMAPLHHHFQMKGNTETQIAFIYALITAVLGTLSIIFVL
jgi:phospho-N-acetylmuramoyl-pentapeptide-transferase